MVEYNLAKVGVAGSIPVSRSYYVRKRISRDGNPFFSSSCIVYLYNANATIPEIHGCARAYEMTGEEQYRKVVENYWQLAVNRRGSFATGGQTAGESWLHR